MHPTGTNTTASLFNLFRTYHKGVIHIHQINGLNSWNKYDGITCGLLIEFRELEKTIFLDIEDMNQVMAILPKKSFTIKDLEEYEIPFFTIPQKKMRKWYTYDLDCFLSRNNLIKGTSKNSSHRELTESFS